MNGALEIGISLGESSFVKEFVMNGPFSLSS